MTQQHASTKIGPASSTAVASPVLRRKCACGNHAAGGECESCKQRLRRKGGVGESLHAVPGIVHDVLNTPGLPLDAATRSWMEPRFGHDFSAVRVHTDAVAARSAEQVDALAYTVGEHVAFATGRYAPASPSGRHLLAHELTHVVQQSGGRAGAGSVAHDEAEADRSADAVVAGHALPPISASRPALRKQHATTAPTGSTAASVDADAARAEEHCDLQALCRQHFQHRDRVDQARVTAAYRRCAPGSLSVVSPGLDPCLSIAAVPPAPEGTPTGPRATPPTHPAPTAPGSGSGASGSSGGLHLPSTTLDFHLGDLQVQLDLPSSLTATLPISYQGVQVLSFRIEAGTSGEFSLTITLNAVPHVRISLRAGVSVGDHPSASAGLVIEATDTVCRAQDPETARAALQRAGNQLRDAVRAAQRSPQVEALRDVVAGIVAVHGAIEAARAHCHQVPSVRVELGAHAPLGPFSPSTPPTDADRGAAPYVGGTVTIPF